MYANNPSGEAPGSTNLRLVNVFGSWPSAVGGDTSASRLDRKGFGVKIIALGPSWLPMPRGDGSAQSASVALRDAASRLVQDLREIRPLGAYDAARGVLVFTKPRELRKLRDTVVAKAQRDQTSLRAIGASVLSHLPGTGCLPSRRDALLF